MKKLIMLISTLFLVACNQGNNEQSPAEGSGKGASGGGVVDSQCELDFSNLKTNTELALMFNSYREHCNPTESQLNVQLNKLEQQYYSEGR